MTAPEWTWLYRTYVGEKLRGEAERRSFETTIAEVTAARLDGYTISRSDGQWKGERETSWLIENVGETPENINHLALELRAHLSQECVLVAAVPTLTWRVDAASGVSRGALAFSSNRNHRPGR